MKSNRTAGLNKSVAARLFCKQGDFPIHCTSVEQENEMIVTFLNQDLEDKNAFCLRHRSGILSCRFHLRQVCPASLV